MADFGLDVGMGLEILGDSQRVAPFIPPVSSALTFVSFWHFYVRQFLALLR